MAKIIICVRARNEQRWLRFFFERMLIQTEQDFEVVLVNNKSTDLSEAVALSYGATIVNIDTYNPSNAINEGFDGAHSNGDAEFGIIISAHCIPTDQYWLERLIRPMDDDDSIVGCYGRQVPMNFSNADNTRDLLFSFGNHSHYVADNIFFHNANSAIRLSYFRLNRFDETVDHIEDLLWAHQAIKNGRRLFYSADSVVWHSHGLHQHKNSSFRSKTVMQAHIGITGFDYPHEDLFEISNLNIAFVLDGNSDDTDRFEKRYQELDASFVWLNRSSENIFHDVKLALNDLRKQDGKFFDIVIFYSEKYECVSMSELLERLATFFNTFSDGVMPVMELNHGICKRINSTEAKLLNDPSFSQDMYMSNMGNFSVFWSDVFENKSIGDVAFVPFLG